MGRGKKVAEENETDDKPPEDDRPAMPTLAGNECRLDITGRCHHPSHGYGYRVDFAEGHKQQRIHFFTSKQDLKPCEWHEELVRGLEATGSRVVLARSAVQPEESKDDIPKKKKGAEADEDDWLDSILGNCMVSKPEPRKLVSADGDDNVDEMDASKSAPTA